MSGREPVGLAWSVVAAFIRLGTNPRVFNRPLLLPEAGARVDGWLAQPCVRVVVPTDRHWDILRRLLTAGQATANLVSDARLAALAIEYGCVLMNTDADFARFPRLKWRNPLAG